MLASALTCPVCASADIPQYFRYRLFRGTHAYTVKALLKSSADGLLPIACDRGSNCGVSLGPSCATRYVGS